MEGLEPGKNTHNRQVKGQLPMTEKKKNLHRGNYVGAKSVLYTQNRKRETREQIELSRNFSENHSSAR